MVLKVDPYPENNCPVCLEGVESVNSIQCKHGHEIHFICFLGMLLHSVNSISFLVCPICRVSYEIREIYLVFKNHISRRPLDANFEQHMKITGFLLNLLLSSLEPLDAEVRKCIENHISRYILLLRKKMAMDHLYLIAEHVVMNVVFFLLCTFVLNNDFSERILVYLQRAFFFANGNICMKRIGDRLRQYHYIKLMIHGATMNSSTPLGWSYSEIKIFSYVLFLEFCFVLFRCVMLVFFVFSVIPLLSMWIDITSNIFVATRIFK